MAENNVANVMDSLMKDMDHLVGSKTVIGEPTVVGDTTFIPLVDVSFGVAAGAVSRDKKNGGAGGLSAKMTPSAILVIQNGHSRLISVKNSDYVTKIIEMVPEAIDAIKARVAVKTDKEEAVKNAFPEGTDPVKKDLDTL